MSYYISKIVNDDFETATNNITESLKNEGFGIVSQIDLKNTFKEKLDADIKPYKILGACSPSFAHKAVALEPHIGAMMPCNVIIRALDDGKIEVAAVDAKASLMAIDNKELHDMLTEVNDHLKQAIKHL